MRTTLRAGLYAGGAVAMLAGLHTALFGARSVPGERGANPSVESELRYYGAYYAAYGLAVLRTVPRADREPHAVRALASTMFLAGVARAGGWLTAGKPHPAQRVLLALELALPPLALAAQNRIAKQARSAGEAKGTSAAVSPPAGPGE